MEFDLAAYLSRNNRLVLHELQQALDLGLSANDGPIDAHEERAMCALGFALAGAYPIFDIDLDAMDFTHQDRIILELALSLHDIGRRIDANAFHPEIGYELLRAHREDLKRAIARHVSHLDISSIPTEEEQLQLILWLVRHHETLDRLYLGECRAVYLDEIADQLCQDCDPCKKSKSRHRCKTCKTKITKAFNLLLVITLCDLIGSSPQDATQTRVAFWRKMTDPDNRKQFSDLSHRITQWTCNEREGRFEGSSAQRTEAFTLQQDLNATARDVFAQRVGHIIDGAPLLKALEPRWRAKLLNEIGNYYSHNFDDEQVSLTFAAKYDSRDDEAAGLLSCYEASIQSGRLRIVAQSENKELYVGRPVGGLGV